MCTFVLLLAKSVDTSRQNNGNSVTQSYSVFSDSITITDIYIPSQVQNQCMLRYMFMLNPERSCRWTAQTYASHRQLFRVMAFCGVVTDSVTLKVIQHVGKNFFFNDLFVMHMNFLAWKSSFFGLTPSRPTPSRPTPSRLPRDLLIFSFRSTYLTCDIEQGEHKHIIQSTRAGPG